jgi:hypothetical protein
MIDVSKHGFEIAARAPKVEEMTMESIIKVVFAVTEQLNKETAAALKKNTKVQGNEFAGGSADSAPNASKPPFDIARFTIYAEDKGYDITFYCFSSRDGDAFNVSGIYSKDTSLSRFKADVVSELRIVKAKTAERLKQAAAVDASVVAAIAAAK